MRTYGRSNDKDVPEDEMLLAKLIQNARAHGLGWTSGEYYHYRGSEMTRCCAAGAAQLTCLTYYSDIINGNDDDDTWTSGADRHETAGWAFRKAMRGNKR